MGSYELVLGVKKVKEFYVLRLAEKKERYVYEKNNVCLDLRDVRGVCG